MIESLSADNFSDYVQKLSDAHPELATIVHEYGEPEPFAGQASFAGLVRIILAQQVAASAAQAALQRLQALLDGDITVSKVLAQPELLEQARLTRQKRQYIHGIAQAIATGALDLGQLEHLPDDAVRKELMAIKGIGPWTAEIYLMSCLGRLDIFPAGDLALRRALQQVQQRSSEPTIAQASALATRYAPYRTVAARLLWHLYVSRS